MRSARRRIRSAKRATSSVDCALIPTSLELKLATLDVHDDESSHEGSTDPRQEFIDFVIVDTIRSIDGIAMSSSASAAGRGMCGVVMRTIGPSRS